MTSSYADRQIAFETNALVINRVTEIERRIGEWAKKPINFSFDPAGTNLFSMEELTRAFARRSAHFAGSIRQLLDSNYIIPAAIIGRALIETVAMGCLFLHDMDRLVTNADRNLFDVRLSKFYAGVRGEAVAPVHVMDAMRHLEKIDREYVKYLDDKYGVFSLAQLAMNDASATTPEDFFDTLSAMKNYDLLSEVAHPNGTGTQLMFGEPSPADDTAKRLLVRLRYSAHMAIWQCHHLIDAADRNAGLSDRFNEVFLSRRSKDAN